MYSSPAYLNGKTHGTSPKVDNAVQALEVGACVATEDGETDGDIEGEYVTERLLGFSDETAIDGADDSAANDADGADDGDPDVKQSLVQ